MLLPSDRHTPEDLEWWARAERLDRLHGMRLARRRTIPKILDEIRAFADAGPCYLATSWGKDSVVVAHLAAVAGVTVPYVHIVQEGPQRDPYQDQVRDAFLARWPVDYHEIVVEELEQEQAEGAKAPGLIEGIKRTQRRFGTKRWISGLRADESGVRKMAARRNMRDSLWPIRWWTAKDVYAWMAHHDLPVHPAYAMTRGGLVDRDHLRVSIIGGKKGRGMGRLEWERFYYPDVIHELDRRAGWEWRDLP